MSFDPFDPMTWREDPDDFVVPTHEMESTITTAEADAEELAQAQEFLSHHHHPHHTDFGGPAFTEGVQDEALRQIRKSMENLDTAVQACQDAEELLATEDVIKAVRERDPVLTQIEELKAQMRQLEQRRWRWPWNRTKGR